MWCEDEEIVREVPYSQVGAASTLNQLSRPEEKSKPIGFIWPKEESVTLCLIENQ